MTDTLQAEVERRMRSVIVPYIAGGGPVVAFVEAVAIVVEMIEETRSIGGDEACEFEMQAAHHKERAEAAEKERDELRELLTLCQTRRAELVEGLVHERDEARKALAAVLNYWEPQCRAEDCDKGSHVEALHAWQAACTIVGCAPAPEEKA